MKVGVIGNAQHQGRRAYQEDAFGFSDPYKHDFVKHGGVLAVLADGMGGMAHGGAASTAAVRAFLAEYERKTASMRPEVAMTRGLASANRQVLSLKERSSNGERAGTTLIAAALVGHQLHWLSVGDSRLYLFREGELTQINGDHTYAEDLEKMVLQKKITQEEALRHPERNELTNYLGMDRLGPADISKRALKIKSVDRILLCSDGLYKALSLVEIASCLSQHNPQFACDTLVDMALKKEVNNQDNITVLVLTPHSGEKPNNLSDKLPINVAFFKKSLKKNLKFPLIPLAMILLLVLFFTLATDVPALIQAKFRSYFSSVETRSPTQVPQKQGEPHEP